MAQGTLVGAGGFCGGSEQVGRARQGTYHASQTRLQTRSAAGPGSLAGREELRPGGPLAGAVVADLAWAGAESPGIWEELRP